MFHEGRTAIDKYLKRDDWHIWASMSKGQMTLPVFQSLQAFWPGLLSLIGDISTAMKSLHNMHSVWKQYGFLPEFYNIPNAEAGANRDSYPLRPELIESVMYLYRATGDPYLLEVGEDILKSIEYSAKTECGYATIKNVKDHRKQDSMESFFLAETTKYLYLLFDPDNFLNSDGGYGTVIQTQNGECIIESSYIFNTEAHPIDMGALRCCHDVPRDSLVKGFSRKKYIGESTFSTPEKAVELKKDEADPKSAEELKKALLDEIMSALTNAKKKIEENSEFQKKFIEVKNRESFSYSNAGKAETSQTLDDSASVETVKLSHSEALDSENLENSLPPTTSAELDDKKIEDVPENINRIITKPLAPSNNSIITDFVQAILKTASRKVKTFDPQILMDIIKENKAGRNDSWTQNYETLTCKAQPYIQRISVMGEFY